MAAVVWYNQADETKRDSTVELDQLSAQAQRQVAGLRLTTKRLHSEGAKFEAQAREWEALVVRKENLLRRYQEFLADIQAERQAIETEYDRIRGNEFKGDYWHSERQAVGDRLH